MSQSFGVYGSLSMRAAYAPPNRRWPMILNALVEKLKRRFPRRLQGPALRSGADPAGGLVVPALSAQLPWHRGAAPGARPRGGPLHSEPVGAGLRAPDRAPAA